jgi:hypothetical protein
MREFVPKGHVGIWAKGALAGMNAKRGRIRSAAFGAQACLAAYVLPFGPRLFLRPVELAALAEHAAVYSPGSWARRTPFPPLSRALFPLLGAPWPEAVRSALLLRWWEAGRLRPDNLPPMGSFVVY